MIAYKSSDQLGSSGLSGDYSCFSDQQRPGVGPPVLAEVPYVCRSRPSRLDQVLTVGWGSWALHVVSSSSRQRARLVHKAVGRVQESEQKLQGLLRPKLRDSI